jgi:CheY-like chemotaxis protein
LTSLCNALHRTAAAGIAVDGIINLVPHPIELVRKDKTVVRGEVRCAIQMSTDHTINSISGIVQLVSDSATAELESTPVDRPGQRHVTAPASKTPIDQKTADSITQQGKILIMDDEDILIDIAAQIGKRMGLIVESAKTGEEAIEIYRKALELGCPHDAILLDMTIAGGMGGLEASQVLHTINPDISTIVMSGYSDHEVMAAPDKYGFKGVISKPFRLTEFGKVLRELIPAEKFKIG